MKMGVKFRINGIKTVKIVKIWISKCDSENGNYLVEVNVKIGVKIGISGSENGIT